MAIPMRGGFSGYVPLNPHPASSAIAEVNTVGPNAGAVRAIDGRPVVPMGGGLSEAGAPAPAPRPIGDRKTRTRSKYADIISGVPYQDVTNQRGPASWWQVASNVLGSGFMPAYAKGLDINNERLGQEEATAQYEQALKGGLDSEGLGKLMGNEFLNPGQQAYLGSLIKEQKPFAVGDRVYDPATRTFTSPYGQGGGGVDPKTLMQFRNDWQQSAGIKNWNAIQPTVASMRQSINNDNKAANLDFLYGAAKVFDPSTGVKEGEMATIFSGMSPVQYIQMMISNVEGGGQLPKEFKEALYGVTQQRAAAIYNQAHGEAQNFYDIGQEYGVPEKYYPPMPPLPEPYASSVLKTPKTGTGFTVE